MDVLDEKGINYYFYHTTAEYARNYNLTIQSLLVAMIHIPADDCCNRWKKMWLLQTTKI